MIVLNSKITKNNLLGISFCYQKKYPSRLFFLLLLFFFPSFTFAQTISGIITDDATNTRLAAVNIYIDGTTIGTISDENGTFQLSNDRFPVAITFSYIGYTTQTITLLSFPDENLEVRLSKASFYLPEIAVTDKIIIDTVYDTNYSVIDYEFYNNDLILLVFKNVFKKYSLLVLEEGTKERYELSLKNYKPQGLFKSCLGGLYLKTSVNAWQIYLTPEKELKMAHRIPILEFEVIFNECIGANKDWVYFYKNLYSGQMRHYYAYPRDGERKTQHIITVADFQKVMQLEDEGSFQSLKAYVMGAHGKKLGEESIYPPSSIPPNMDMGDLSFVKNIFYQPIFVPMQIEQDKLTLFDHANHVITTISIDGKEKKSIDITYHQDKKWRKEIIIDDISNRVFTLFDTQWGLSLVEIYKESGKAGKPRRFSRPFIEKIKVHNGHLYFIFHDPLTKDYSKRLERIAL